MCKTRKDILERAVNECMAEMYAKAQPQGDWYQLCEDAKNGKIGKDERVYERYYLSSQEFGYILNKYKEMYRIKEEWSGNVGVVEEYLRDGGSKDKWIEDWTDENGHYHPGYRGYEKVPPILEQFNGYLADKVADKELAAKYAAEITDIVMKTVGSCKSFYRFDREDSQFSVTVCLGASPTCNADTVREWWKENKGIDVEIVERNPLLFWEYDHYGDEIDDIMTEEHGENWRQHFDDEWKAQQEEKKRKEEEMIQRIKEAHLNKD